MLCEGRDRVLRRGVDSPKHTKEDAKSPLALPRQQFDSGFATSLHSIDRYVTTEAFCRLGRPENDGALAKYIVLWGKDRNLDKLIPCGLNHGNLGGSLRGNLDFRAPYGILHPARERKNDRVVFTRERASRRSDRARLP